MSEDNGLTRRPLARPSWLTRRIPASGNFAAVQNIVGDLGIHTVCQSAVCPNMGECFSAATATFLILGAICTRTCGYCAVSKGIPLPIDAEEPYKVAQAVDKLQLKHAVITSVTRDDLADGGALQFAACISEIRKIRKGTAVEVLVPDFEGDDAALSVVLQARPEVFNHNMETVPRLFGKVRPRADYGRSLAILSKAARAGIEVVKSGIMLGLGESEAEILEVFRDIHAANATTLTIGQYLSPSLKHLPVEEYVTPDKFAEYERLAYDVGFKKVTAGPLVRSSYHAADHYQAGR